MVSERAPRTGTYRPTYGRRVPDLTGGLCIGSPDFTEQPTVVQYRACLLCPVADRCPAVTPWPKTDCCRQGHDKDTYNNGRCRACQSEEKKVSYAVEKAREVCPYGHPEFKPWCSNCRRNAAIQSQADAWKATVEEVAFLLQSGMSVREVARRVGYERPQSLGRRLRRHGHVDLARRFDLKTA